MDAITLLARITVLSLEEMARLSQDIVSLIVERTVHAHPDISSRELCDILEACGQSLIVGADGGRLHRQMVAQGE